ncbi:hypothetical protein FBQ97_14555 [Acidobacteria bacterium ACD]|nr:hypothetical protein [Acidobacteria bacterium ACD]
MTVILSPAGYVAAVRAALRDLPEPRPGFRPTDRRLALDLHRRGASIDILRAAIRLATLRRLSRDPSSPPLAPVRSLYYFLPVVEDLLRLTPDPAWLAYVDASLDKLIATAPSTPPAGQSAPVQISAVSSER